jgi:hypothetical protein
VSAPDRGGATRMRGRYRNETSDPEVARRVGALPRLREPSTADQLTYPRHRQRAGAGLELLKKHHSHPTLWGSATGGSWGRTDGSSGREAQRAAGGGTSDQSTSQEHGKCSAPLEVRAHGYPLVIRQRSCSTPELVLDAIEHASTGLHLTTRCNNVLKGI